MLYTKDIVKENKKILRETSKYLALPLSKKDIKTLKMMMEYLVNSQDAELAEKYQLRGGVGIAAPQVNQSKQMLCIYLAPSENKDKIQYTLINPEIVEHSDEIIYLTGGEGCLSVDRVTSGLTPRYKWIKVRAFFYDIVNEQYEEKEMIFSDYLSIVLQHEIDHLHGIMFTDKLFKDLPQAEPISY